MKTVALVAALLAGGLMLRAQAAAPKSEDTPVRYMQRDRGGSYYLVAKFINARACEKYRAMQAQVTCVETSACAQQPELCKGKPVSSGPISCWRDLDMGADFGRCE